MTVDLTRARPGCVVEFRCGGKAAISEVSLLGYTILIRTTTSRHDRIWHLGGGYNRATQDDWDIISLTDPPLTEAERLAEIAQFLRSLDSPPRGEGYFMLHTVKWNELLALAEGRI